jgi:hypothetical protein
MDRYRDRVMELRSAPLPRPGYLVIELERSADFWDDALRERSRRAWDEFEIASEALVAALAAEWGPAETVDLGATLYRAVDGDPPPLADLLSNYVPRVFAWHFADRSVCVGVGQHDREFPVMLVAAAGPLVDG